jgi:hypothetical protein
MIRYRVSLKMMTIPFLSCVATIIVPPERKWFEDQGRYFTTDPGTVSISAEGERPLLLFGSLREERKDVRGAEVH